MKIAVLAALLLSILTGCENALGSRYHCNPPGSEDCNYRTGGVYRD